MPPSQTVCGCSATLPLSDWALHQRRYHRAFLGGYACLECAFASRHFEDAIAHCLLHGHRLDRQILQRKDGDAVGGQGYAELRPEESASDGMRSLTNEVNVNAAAEENSESTVRSQKSKPTVESSSSESEQTVQSQKSEPTVQSQSSEPIVQSKPSEPIPIEESSSSKEESNNTAQTKDNSDPTAANQKRPQSPLQSIACSRCNSLIKWSPSASTLQTYAAQHVRSCLRIRPFRCSKCGHQASRAWDMRYHISRKCPGAAVEVLKEEECESALRFGLDWCFPGL